MQNSFQNKGPWVFWGILVTAAVGGVTGEVTTHTSTARDVVAFIVWAIVYAIYLLIVYTYGN
jgi:hypothetical protein